MHRHRGADPPCAWSPTSRASRPPRSRTCSPGAAAADPASPSTRPQRVHAAARELNYRPNRAARTIRTGRSDTVQLSLHMLSDPWSLAVAAAVNEEANRHGLTTLILADGDWYAALDRVESDVAYLDGAVDTDDGKRKLASLVERGQRLVVFSETLEPDGLRRDPLRRDPRLLPRDGPPARAAHGDRMPRGRGRVPGDGPFAVHAVRRTHALARTAGDPVAHRDLHRDAGERVHRGGHAALAAASGRPRSTPRPTSPRSRRSTRRTCSDCGCRTTSP